jgi:hypothetical protein
MKKVVLLAIVLLMSGLSFAQTTEPSPYFDYSPRPEGYTLPELVDSFNVNLNSPETQSLAQSFREIAIEDHWPSYMVNQTTPSSAIFFLSCGKDTFASWIVGEKKIYGIKNGVVTECKTRGPLAAITPKKVEGLEPGISFNSAQVLKEKFDITIPPTPTRLIVLRRCGNVIKDKKHFVPTIPVFVVPNPVVERVQTQQMSHDTTIVNVTIEIPDNFGNSNNVIQDDGASMVAYDNNQNYYNNNANYYQQDNYSTPVRNLNAFMTANANVEGQCGTYDGNVWGNNYGYFNNQNYYNNANYSNTASWGNASAGASFTITGTATTVPVVTYNPSTYYQGNSFRGQRQNNNNNGGRVVQQRRGTNQKQNNQQQNQNQTIAENKNAKPWDGNVW